MTGIESRRRLTALAGMAAGLLLGALPHATALAQAGLPPGVRGPDGAVPGGVVAGARSGGQAATRSVSRYLDQERALIDALARRDTTALGALLAVDFVARSSASADVADSADWLARELRSPRAGLVRDLTVREADDLAVVSFLLDHPGAKGSDFVVDVWRQSTGRLLSRSSSRAANAPARPAKPDGRG